MAVIELSARVRAELGDDHVLVVDWHRLAICCAAAGEISLRRARRSAVRGRDAFRPLPADPAGSVYVHRLARPHLAGRDVAVDCHRRLGFLVFTTTLPADFGLRASLGRLGAGTPAPD